MVQTFRGFCGLEANHENFTHEISTLVLYWTRLDSIMKFFPRISDTLSIHEKDLLHGIFMRFYSMLIRRLRLTNTLHEHPLTCAVSKFMYANDWLGQGYLASSRQRPNRRRETARQYACESSRGIWPMTVIFHHTDSIVCHNLHYPLSQERAAPTILAAGCPRITYVPIMIVKQVCSPAWNARGQWPRLQMYTSY